MTVAQLIELLQKQDLNARVFFKSPYDDEETSIDEVVDDEGIVFLLQGIIMKLSERKQLQICNIIYANVASEFACMMNPRYRGQNFNWDGWIERMDRWVPIWLEV